MKNLISLSVALVLLSISSANAQQRQLTHDVPGSERVALVIGNSAYDFAQLKNPVNDASDMAMALRELGFDVIHKENYTDDRSRYAFKASSIPFS